MCLKLKGNLAGFDVKALFFSQIIIIVFLPIGQNLSGYFAAF